jgi:hypothetical protein
MNSKRVRLSQIPRNMTAVGSFAALPTAVDVAAHYADYAKHDAEPKTSNERFH